MHLPSSCRPESIAAPFAAHYAAARFKYGILRPFFTLDRRDGSAPAARRGRARGWRIGLSLLLALAPAAEAVERRVVNDGQLVLEGIPEIPPGLPDRLARFHETSATSFLAWSLAGDQIYVRTRFGGVHQIHRVAQPKAEQQPMGGSPEPVGEVARQPAGHLLAYTEDRGGSGLDQIHLLDPRSGETRPLTAGQALNNRMVWDRNGRRLAFRSTRRNGRSNDIWIMDVTAPAQARMVLAAPDGALWKPVQFSPDGSRLLVQYYASITDSRIYLLELATGEYRLLVGSAEAPTSNVASGFDALGTGVHFITNQRDRAAEIGWISTTEASPIEFVPGDIQWDITGFELSPDAARGAFVTNEEGISRLFLYDPEKRRHKRVRHTPVGVISDLRFSPDGRRLGMTISTSRTPSDAFVLKLKARALSYGRLQRWTLGDVGGLDERNFIEPQLVHYPAPLLSDERYIYIPAFVYLPRRRGPAPVVIFVHGGPEGQFRPDFNSLIQMWVQTLGVAVIAPNVRGSLGYGKAYLSMDDGRLRENAVSDLGALLDWIAEQPKLDGSRVAIYGASYGGYMALAGAVHFSDRLRAAVDRAGISNFVTYLENTQDYRRDLRRAEYGDERDPEMRAFLERISPLNNVAEIDIPLLIAQGQNDPVVPVSESEQMVQALRQRGQTVWYFNALNEGHGHQRKANRDVFQQVTHLFLEQFLLGD